jgi:hypothetical protein
MSQAAGAQQRELVSWLRAVVDAENAVLRQEMDAERKLRRRLELRIAELERQIRMESPESGTSSSKERIGAKEARRQRTLSGVFWRGQPSQSQGTPGHSRDCECNDSPPHKR